MGNATPCFSATMRSTAVAILLGAPAVARANGGPHYAGGVHDMSGARTRLATGSYGGTDAARDKSMAAPRDDQTVYGNTRADTTGAGYSASYDGAGAMHPPAVVNHYYASGCYQCGGWGGRTGPQVSDAGLAAGAAEHATTSGTGADRTEVDRTAAATGTSRTGAPTAALAGADANAHRGYAIGDTYGVLPAGSIAIAEGESTYYQVGNSWFAPAYGANGTYYRVVVAPF